VSLKGLRQKIITNSKNPHPLFTADEGFYLLIFYYRLSKRTAPPAVTTTKIVEVIFLVLRRIKKQRCALTFENRPETADFTFAIVRIKRTFSFVFFQF
jgi:hypothetical protein